MTRLPLCSLQLRITNMPMQYRRSDYDVTNTVQVSSPEAVRRAVLELYKQTWPNFSFAPLDAAFRDFEKLFSGLYPGYFGCDTVYHDMQHSLDGTLACARLFVANDRTHAFTERMGPERAMLGVICALFHDSGYIRRVDEPESNGAEYTLYHVARSAEFLEHYLPSIDMSKWVPVATQIVHFTGYEKPFDQIETSNSLDRKAGHLIGTADLIAQMSDRCYLEKCRDRLYPEFVLGGVAVKQDEDTGRHQVRFGSGLDVLRGTPDFVETVMRTHLDGEFGSAYRSLEVLYNGRNPYVEAIENSMSYLKQIMRTGGWPMLRRDPPCFTWEKNSVQTVRTLALGRLKDMWVKNS